MATDATIILQQLHCIRESEGGSEPYIWPVLLWIDDTTLATEDRVGVTIPVLADARVVLKSDMTAGQAAGIPFPLGTLGVRFEDPLSMRYVLLAVALLEKDETPEAAMWAGRKAFSNELRAAVAENLLALRQAITQQDDAQLQQLIEQIKARVKNRVTAATWDALTGWQKTRVLLGTLNLDDFIGVDYRFSEPVRTPLSLSLKSENRSDEYKIEGMLEVRMVAETVDLCQAQVDQVKATQAVVDGLEAQRSVLQTQLQHASPAQKAYIIAQLTQLAQDLTIAMAALEEARAALKVCRNRWTEIGKIKAQSATAGTAGVST